MSDVDEDASSTTTPSVPTVPFVDLQNYLQKLLEFVLDASPSQASTFCVSNKSLLTRFLVQTDMRALFILKSSSQKDIDHTSSQSAEYSVHEKILSVSSRDLTWLAVLKRSASMLQVGVPLSQQLQFLSLPGSSNVSAQNNAENTLPDSANEASVYDTLHTYIHHAVVPFFDAFVNSNTGHDSLSQIVSTGDLRSRDEKDGKMAAKKKIAELDLTLTNLQQNVVIPDVRLNIHPMVQKAIQQARVNGRRVSVAEDIGESTAADPAFLNSLQSCVNGWIKDIHKVTQLTRDATTGTSAQEMHFWLALESELEKVDSHLKSDAVGEFLLL